MDEAPDPFVGFAQMILEHYDELTKSEKRIADYMSQNQDEAAFLSAAEIAGRLDLSEATMVRFARALNFDSYPALRESLQENFRHRVTHSARLRSSLGDLLETGDIFERLVASEINFLTESLQSLDREAFHAAVGCCARINAFLFLDWGRLYRWWICWT
jgi:DNA-binding MurR/RpiR family transcriptional regulator